MDDNETLRISITRRPDSFSWRTNSIGLALERNSVFEYLGILYVKCKVPIVSILLWF